jgi:trk system potassium uptake protein TrkH
MNIRVIFKLLGLLFISLAIVLAIPAGFSAIIHGRDLPAFLETMAACSFLGAILWYFFRNQPSELNHRTGFAVVSVSWCAACVVGAFPFYLSGVLPSFVDALFETTSGFTGTGSSVFPDVEILSQEILLWRSMTQWLGGLGIIVLFLAVLPALGRGGVQLYNTEMSGIQKDKVTPRVREAAKKLWRLYLWYTLALIALLVWAGMSAFDAINHAFAAIATGGFSTKNTGIAFYQNTTIDYILIVFMFLGSVNFSLQYRAFFQGDWSGLRGTEFRWYIAILFIATVLMTLKLAPGAEFFEEENIRHSIFTVVNTVSTTGFTYSDYTLWPAFAQTLILFLIAMGGMQGSTAGGVKCIRVVGSVLQIFREFRQTVHPSAALSVRIDRQSLSENTTQSINALLAAYLLSSFLVILILTWEGFDIPWAIASAFTTLSNTGPALGPYGPMGNFSTLSDTAKVTLTIAMLVGKLEFFTILVLFTREYWKK